MKIAIFSDCYLDLTGGIVSVINTEKAELEKRGHEVVVFSSAYVHSEKEIKKLAENHIYPVPSCKHFGNGLTPIARRPKIVEKWLLENHPEIKKYDIFYIHYEAGCSIAGLRLAKKYKIPSVQVMHGREDAGEEKLIPFGLRTIVATLLNWFHSWYIPHKKTVKRDEYCATTKARAKMWTMMVNHANYANYIITPSEHFKAKLIRYGVKKPITAMHHGIKDELIKEKVSKKSLRDDQIMEIIWHSRVSGEKRPFAFLNALDILQTKYKIHDYHLSVYGDGPDLKKAKQFTKKHKLNVSFYGVKPFPKIWQAMKQAHLDVLVSYNYDTFGMTLIEGAAAGIPSLFADMDMREILPRGSYFMTYGPSSEFIAERLAYILTHRNEVAEKSKILIDYRDKITITHKIDRLEKFFKKISK
jgi:glycosyltransferase involved in cell wall biosynthesis